MSQLHVHRWDNWTNTGLNGGSTCVPKLSSPPSPAWTPIQPTYFSKPQPFRVTSIACSGVCSKAECRLQAHRSSNAAKYSKSGTTLHHLGSGRPYNTSPKEVDDQAIRTAFFKSYAFVEPSYLSVLVPSSFRLDVFHDLPVSGGDRPDTHRLIRDFFNRHFQSLFDDERPQTLDLLTLQGSCLEAVMIDPTVCVYLLAAERATQKRSSSPEQDYHLVEMLATLYQQNSNGPQLTSSGRGSVQGMAATIIYFCVRLLHELHHRSSRPLTPSDWSPTQLPEPNTNDVKRITLHPTASSNEHGNV